jgi:hypothetical protein
VIHRLDDASQLQPGDVVALDERGHLGIVASDPALSAAGRISVQIRHHDGTSRYYGFAEGLPFDAYRVQLPTEQDESRKAFYDDPAHREPANDDKPVARKPRMTAPTVEPTVLTAVVEDLQRMRGDIDEINRRLAQLTQPAHV